MNQHDRDARIDAVHDMYDIIINAEDARLQLAIRAHAAEPLVDIDAARRMHDAVCAAAFRARIATVAAIRAEYNSTKSTEEK